MTISEADEAALAAKFAVMRPFLDERGWRVYLGTEANTLGYGGVAAVARAARASETTVAAGAAEAADPAALALLERGRSRRPGAGRPKAEDAQPGLKKMLDGLLEEGRRGDPVSGVTWTILSLRDIARQMAVAGFACSKDTIARLMHADGYSLQGMAKVLEGRQHPDRDAQFRNINAAIAEYQAAGQPVISTDGKKKERLGAYYRDGKSWRPAGDPVRVRDHDFPDKDTVTISPYGIYDIAANRGFVSVGTSRETAAFAVNAIRLWWQEEGSLRYPGAARLLIVCDAGGSNGCRSRLWKDRLAALAAAAGLRIQVMHFPPGTSKWNKIEHRLFCHITRTWRARPLMTVDDAVAGIAATITAQGLKCCPVRDDAVYPGGVKVSDARMKDIEDRILERDGFHGEWNYAILPVPGPGPEPEARPARGRVPRDILNHPALTGIPSEDLTALAGDLRAQFEARLQLSYRTRSGARVTTPRSTAPNANRRLDVTDHLLALRLRRHLNLPADAVGALLGVSGSRISHATTLAAELLATARTTLPDTPPANLPRTPAELLGYTAANGIPLTIPENGQKMPDRFSPRKSKSSATHPKTPTK